LIQVKAIVTINAPPCMTIPHLNGEEELPQTYGYVYKLLSTLQLRERVQRRCQPFFEEI